ncbi:alpha/beta hydrolase [Virgibacillus sp. LDC-1]|uniref:alpha/beta fold hydrolase n=1 Tax=Virgibacillus sp. LDC-1 TaxID=3039856 RepID=UPI0024DE2D94|nr:alpha/beta hydrolase [Virgibacillus sp. LDC-1]
MNTLMQSYYSMLSLLLDNGAYFNFQYVDLTNKKKMDEIDQEGIESAPNFQQYIFSSEEFFQDFIPLSLAVQKPVLIIAGKKDDAVGPTHHHAFKFPIYDIQQLNTGHHPYVEHPSAFKRAILRFIHDNY